MKKFLLGLVLILLFCGSAIGFSESNSYYSVSFQVIDENGSKVDMTDDYYAIRWGTCDYYHNSAPFAIDYNKNGNGIFENGALNLKSEATGDLHYVIYGDTGAGLYIFQGKISKNNLIKGKTTEITLKMASQNKVKLSTSLDKKKPQKSICFIRKEGERFSGEWGNEIAQIGEMKGGAITAYIPKGEYGIGFLVEEGANYYIYDMGQVNIQKSEAIVFNMLSKNLRKNAVDISDLRNEFDSFFFSGYLATGHALVQNNFKQSKFNVFLQEYSQWQLAFVKDENFNKALLKYDIPNAKKACSKYFLNKITSRQLFEKIGFDLEYKDFFGGSFTKDRTSDLFLELFEVKSGTERASSLVVNSEKDLKTFLSNKNQLRVKISSKSDSNFVGKSVFSLNLESGEVVLQFLRHEK